MHRNVALVLEAARRHGLDLQPRRFPEGTRTAAEAARAVGVDEAQIVKSLVFAVDGRLVLALVAGSNRLDEALLAAAAEGEQVARPDADAVREASGFPIGGVPPFGHPDQLPTYVDEDLLAFDEVWAAAGTPHDVFPVPPKELVRVTGGVVCALARR